MRKFRLSASVIVSLAAIIGTSAYANQPVSAQEDVRSGLTTRPGQVEEARGDGFSLRSLQAGEYPAVSTGRAAHASPSEVAKTVRVLRIKDSKPALVDSSLANAGMATATTGNAVELSWRAAPGTRYLVVRSGRSLGQVKAVSSEGYFRDASMKPGAAYQYVVAPADGSTAEQSWSVNVTVPKWASEQTEAAALQHQSQRQIAAARAAATTTVTWDAFIAQARVSAPRGGCSYGSAYEFGGDNRSFDWRSDRYRTSASAVITWRTKSVAGFVSVRPTKVYRKSTGKFVAKKTASSRNMVARKSGSGTGYVTLRLVNHAANPYCRVGAIDGAISIQITKSGNWAIRSGNHRRMPHHHIYIYNGGRVSTVYKRKAQNVMCLVGAAVCDLSNLTGYTGTYN